MALLLNFWTLPKLKSKWHCDWRSVSKSWCRAPSGAHDQILLLFDSYGLVFCGAPSLTRGLVSLLSMLLTLASAIFLGSESLGIYDHILLSDLRLPFSLPPTTGRVTVEVFDRVNSAWTLPSILNSACNSGGRDSRHRLEGVCISYLP
jgi:hypothetical protein